jgi:hypothetical protein
MVMKVKWRREDMEKIKCNNQKIRKVGSFIYLGSKAMTNGREQEKITEGLRYGGRLYLLIKGYTLEIGNTTDPYGEEA